MTGEFVLATRGSELARVQARIVAERLAAAYPALVVHEEIIRTTGDRHPEQNLASLGGSGVFTRELEQAVLDGRAAAAVHSLKDLPVELPRGLVLGAVLERRNPGDVLVSARPGGLDGLPEGSKIGTGSPRRRAMMLALRNNLEVVPIRGNVPTRLGKVAGGAYDAVILAAAGLERLDCATKGMLEVDGMMLHATPLETFLPAPGQGAIAVEVRVDDERAREIAGRINHPESETEVRAERAVLAALGGGCHLALGARGRVDGSILQLEAVVFDDSGGAPKHAVLAAGRDDPESLGRALAEKLHGG